MVNVMSNLYYLARVTNCLYFENLRMFFYSYKLFLISKHISAAVQQCSSAAVLQC